MSLDSSLLSNFATQLLPNPSESNKATLVGFRYPDPVPFSELQTVLAASDNSAPPSWILIRLDSRNFALVKWTPVKFIAKSSKIIDQSRVNEIKQLLSTFSASIEAANSYPKPPQPGKLSQIHIPLEKQCTFPEELEDFLKEVETELKKREEKFSVKSNSAERGGGSGGGDLQVGERDIESLRSKPINLSTTTLTKSNPAPVNTVKEEVDLTALLSTLKHPGCSPSDLNFSSKDLEKSFQSCFATQLLWSPSEGGIVLGRCWRASSESELWSGGKKRLDGIIQATSPDENSLSNLQRVVKEIGLEISAMQEELLKSICEYVSKSKASPCWLILRLEASFQKFALLKWTPLSQIAKGAKIIDSSNVEKIKAQLRSSFTRKSCSATSSTVGHKFLSLEKQCSQGTELEKSLLGEVLDLLKGNDGKRIADLELSYASLVGSELSLSLPVGSCGSDISLGNGGEGGPSSSQSNTIIDGLNGNTATGDSSHPAAAVNSETDCTPTLQREILPSLPLIPLEDLLEENFATQLLFVPKRERIAGIFQGLTGLGKDLGPIGLGSVVQESAAVPANPGAENLTDSVKLTTLLTDLKESILAAQDAPCWVFVRLDEDYRHFALLKWTPVAAIARGASIIDEKSVTKLRTALENSNQASQGVVAVKIVFEKQCSFESELDDFLLGQVKKFMSSRSASDTDILNYHGQRAAEDIRKGWRNGSIQGAENGGRFKKLGGPGSRTPASTSKVSSDVTDTRDNPSSSRAPLGPGDTVTVTTETTETASAAPAPLKRITSEDTIDIVGNTMTSYSVPVTDTPTTQSQQAEAFKFLKSEDRDAQLIVSPKNQMKPNSGTTPTKLKPISSPAPGVHPEFSNTSNTDTPSKFQLNNSANTVSKPTNNPNIQLHTTQDSDRFGRNNTCHTNVVNHTDNLAQIQRDLESNRVTQILEDPDTKYKAGKTLGMTVNFDKWLGEEPWFCLIRLAHDLSRDSKRITIASGSDDPNRSSSTVANSKSESKIVSLHKVNFALVSYKNENVKTVADKFLDWVRETGGGRGGAELGF